MMILELGWISSNNQW